MYSFRMPWTPPRSRLTVTHRSRTNTETIPSGCPRGKLHKWRRLSKRRNIPRNRIKEKAKCDILCLQAFDVSPKLKTNFFFRIMENSSTDLAIENRINGFHSADKDESEYKKFKILQSTDQIKELQTIIRDKETSRFILNYINDMKQTRVFWW